MYVGDCRKQPDSPGTTLWSHAVDDAEKKKTDDNNADDDDDDDEWISKEPSVSTMRVGLYWSTERRWWRGVEHNEVVVKQQAA